MTEPLEFIRVQPLTHGVRVDIQSHHTASGVTRSLNPQHFPTIEIARRYADMLHKATGFKIIEGTST